MAEVEKGGLHQHDSNISNGTNGVSASATANGTTNGTATGAAPQGRRTFVQKTRHHCTRFWWVHLIILIVVVLVITLPLVYVAYPRIAQSGVNKSILNVTSMDFKNPTADAFDLALTSVLTTHSSYHPTIDAFTASMFLAGTMVEFLTIPIPKTQAVNGTVTNIDTYVVLNDTDAFAQYATAMIQNETVIVYFKGRPGLKEGGLPTTTVNYDKTITLTGFNGLADLSITNLTLLTTTQADGANMEGTVSIPNPTVQTLDLGNLTLTLSLPTNISNTTSPLAIGTSTINNTILIPSTSNTFTMRSTVNETLLLTYLEADPSLAGSAGLPLLIQGTKAVVNGTEIPWLTTALTNPLSVIEYDLQIGDALIDAGLGSLVPGYSSSSSSSSASATATSSSSSTGTAASATTTAAGIL